MLVLLPYFRNTSHYSLLLHNPEMLHAPYVDMNEEILRRLEAGQPQEAAAALEAYLGQSERTVLAAFARAAGEVR